MRDLTVDYGEFRALEALGLDRRAGRCLVVRGSNGAGKSTLLRVLAGVIRPTSGTATVGGRVADRRDGRLPRAGRGAAERATDRARPHARGAPGARRRLVGSRRTCRPRRGRDLLDAFDAAHLARRFPHELSSGQAQAFALCLTLARPADVLLLDEPEQRLDEGRIALLSSSSGSAWTAGRPSSSQRTALQLLRRPLGTRPSTSHRPAPAVRSGRTRPGRRGALHHAVGGPTLAGGDALHRVRGPAHRSVVAVRSPAPRGRGSSAPGCSMSPSARPRPPSPSGAVGCPARRPRRGPRAGDR